MANIDLLSGRMVAQLMTANNKWIATVDMITISNKDIEQLLALGYKIVLVDSSILHNRNIEEHIDIPAAVSGINISNKDQE
jgi:hypothetical protein